MSTRFNGRLACRFDAKGIRTPAFVVDEGLLRDNLAILAQVKEATGCKILLALKCFAMFRVFPLLNTVLDGVCCSSPHEARLGREDFGREVHSFAAAFSAADIEELALTSDHLVFNSFRQKELFMEKAEELARAYGRELHFGLRINPEHSEGTVPLYDPCAPGSRLGIKRADFKNNELAGIKGLHWHNLCEQNADCLKRTVAAVEARFGDILPAMEYVNFGGGHHITRPGYNIAMLERCITRAQQDWGVTVYLEPGEACALNAGFLLSRVLDVVQNGDTTIAILDASAACHMPDVIEMPYRPPLFAAAEPGEKPCTVRLAGPTCLAGDIIGDYAFDEPLKIGDRLVFCDMAIYSMVKTNTFNGMNLPAIAIFSQEKTIQMVKQFLLG